MRTRLWFSIVSYYNSGQLATWCRVYDYDFLNKLQGDNDYQTILNICSELNIEIIDVEKYISEYKGELVEFGSIAGIKMVDNPGSPICFKYVEDPENRYSIQWIKIAEKEDKVLLMSKKVYPHIIEKCDKIQPVTWQEYVKIQFEKWFTDDEKSKMYPVSIKGEEFYLFPFIGEEYLKYGFSCKDDNVPFHVICVHLTKEKKYDIIETWEKTK